MLVLEKMAPDSALLRSVLLQDDQGQLMAITPQAGLLDLGLIHQQTQREVVSVDFSGSSCLPLSEYFGVSALVDQQILMMETVYFKAGDANVLIGMRRDAFMKLQQNAHFGSICVPLQMLLENTDLIKTSRAPVIHLTPRRMKKRIQGLLNLPIMPNLTSQLLHFRLDRTRESQSLVDLIQTDPSLSLQVLSWVQSPKIQSHQTLKTIDEAISTILGVDLTLNLSLMTGLSEPLKMPKTGKLGWQAYWRSALLAGVLSKDLSKMMHPRLEEKHQIAYYAGLFHNIGLLILSEVFPSYYHLLNQLVMLNTHLSIPMIEQYTFGLTHYELAAWLMKSWILPKEMIAASQWYFADKIQLGCIEAKEAKIVRLATHLLAEQHIGEGQLILPQKTLCEDLGLSQEQAAIALEKCLSQMGFIHRLTQ